MGRAPCCDKANVKKGPWSPEEDAKLKDYIEKHGTGGNWITLPQKAGLRRCGKSCRLRWLNYLRPNIKHGEFSDDEDRIICNLFANIGSRWSIIAAQLPGRTDNDIKNYWNTKLKKKLLRISATQKKPQNIQHHHHDQQQNHNFPSNSLQNTFHTGLNQLGFHHHYYPQDLISATDFNNSISLQQLINHQYNVTRTSSENLFLSSGGRERQASSSSDISKEIGFEYNNERDLQKNQLLFESYICGGNEEKSSLEDINSLEYSFEEIMQMLNGQNPNPNPNPDSSFRFQEGRAMYLP